MQRFTGYRLCGLCVLTMLGAQVSLPAARAAEVSVTLASGRTFTAEVSALTNDLELWLETSRGRARLRRPIAWDRIAAAEINGKAITVDALKSSAASLVSVTEDVSPVEAPVAPAPVEGPRFPVYATYVEPVPPPKVAALAIDAYLGRWTSGVDTSGLIVEVYPLDADGRLVPIDGTLEVYLIGQRQVAWRPSERLGDWRRAITAGDFAGGAARVRLPFAAVHPEYDVDLWPIGLVHARLSVPGHGVFDASAATVRIRPYSGFRDRLQLQEGLRFHPIERTSRGDR